MPGEHDPRLPDVVIGEQEERLSPGLQCGRDPVLNAALDQLRADKHRVDEGGRPAPEVADRERGALRVTDGR